MSRREQLRIPRVLTLHGCQNVSTFTPKELHICSTVCAVITDSTRLVCGPRQFSGLGALLRDLGTAPLN